jgi:hypothetical protein
MIVWRINGEKFARRAARAWRLRRQLHIGSSYDSLNLRVALHHARLLSRSGAAAFKSRFGRGTADDAACGRAGASGAAATFLSMRVCRRSAASHARLLARRGAAAFGRTGASGTSFQSSLLANTPPLALKACARSSSCTGQLLQRCVVPSPGSMCQDLVSFNQRPHGTCSVWHMEPWLVLSRVGLGGASLWPVPSSCAVCTSLLQRAEL